MPPTLYTMRVTPESDTGLTKYLHGYLTNTYKTYNPVIGMLAGAAQLEHTLDYIFARPFRL